MVTNFYIITHQLIVTNSPAFFPRTVPEWNNLPARIVQCNSLDILISSSYLHEYMLLNCMLHISPYAPSRFLLITIHCIIIIIIILTVPRHCKDSSGPVRLVDYVIPEAVTDLGFSKGGFCSAEECKLSSARSCKQKKVINFIILFFSLSTLNCFPFFSLNMLL